MLVLYTQSPETYNLIMSNET